jgi:hypothetical protein
VIESARMASPAGPRASPAGRRPPRRARRPGAWGAVLAGLLLARAPLALDRVELSLGRVEGAGWWAEGVRLVLGLGDAGPSLELAAPVLVLPAPLAGVEGARLRCPTLTVRDAGYHCAGATLDLRGTLLDRPELAVDLTYDPRSGRLEARLLDVRLAGGRLALAGRRGAEGWALSGEGEGLALAELPARLGLAAGLPPGWRASGQARLRVEAEGAGARTLVTLQGSAAGVGFGDGSGRREGQALAGTLAVRAERQDLAWQVEGSLRLDRGQLYLDPVFLDAGKAPLEAEGAGTWDPASGLLDLGRVRYHHPGVVELEGRLQGRLEPALGLPGGQVTRLDARLGPLYDTYLQPLLRGTVLDRLAVTGTAGGEARWTAAGPQAVRLALREAAAEDLEGRFGLRGVDGEVRWAARGPVEPSELRWAGGNLFRVPFGAAGLAATAAGDELRLARPLELPVLGGSAIIERLEAWGLGTPAPGASLEGLLTPVSMEALSAALGWPSLGGALSGVVPALRYADGRVQVEGALLVRVFDGEVVIKDLVLERPFGVVPKASADLDVRALDLQALTRAFSFGMIEGRLGGWVRGLRLEGWRPVAFDARLETPTGDRSRHRISQRAVESLASLGGPSGTLSRAFFGLFQEFSYARLGIACRLRAGVCEMDGVGPADGGYAIVEGGGIPRIDVVGYNRRVDWETLVARLRDATQVGAPRME